MKFYELMKEEKNQIIVLKKEESKQKENSIWAQSFINTLTKHFLQGNTPNGNIPFIF